MTQASVLVVDDEVSIHRFLHPSFTAEGYRVIQAMRGGEALAALAAERPDIVVLDLGLPDMDGKQVIERIRRVSDVPIIVLSARDREAEKVRALDLGADDFVNKPFGVGELMARIRASLRSRTRAPNDTLFVSGEVSLDLSAHVVRLRGEEVKLTPREFDVLTVLFRHCGKVVTHAQILRDVWGPANREDTQYLRVYIGHLRGKLETDPAAPRLILTEPGIGYRLV